MYIKKDNLQIRFSKNNSTFIVLLSILSLIFNSQKNNTLYSKDTFTDSLTNISVVLDNSYKEIGQPLIIVVNFKIKKDWHIYWKNPGDSGLETTFDWDFKSDDEHEDFKLINAISDIPHKHTTDNITDYIYDGEFNYYFEFAVKIDSKQNFQKKSNKYKLIINYLICNEICIPVTKEKEFVIDFKLDTTNIKLNNPNNLSFKDFKLDYKRLKNEYKKLSTPASYTLNDKKLILEIGKDELKKYLTNIKDFETFNNNILFFPYQNGLINNTAKVNYIINQNNLIIEIDKDDYANEFPQTFSGILINNNLWSNNSKAIEIEFHKK